MMKKSDTWNPKQYELFKIQREKPFDDLLQLIRTERPIATAVDLGCGTGELTRRLHSRFQIKHTIGLDLSANMLSKSVDFAAPGLTFIEGNLEIWRAPSGVDLILANASLQWSNNHKLLFANLISSLAPGGQFAVQVPANHDHSTHRIAADIASEEPFRSALAGFSRKSPVLAPEEYATILHSLGMGEISVSLKVYCHLLESSRSAIDWVRGTLLTDYEKRLHSNLFEKFMNRYTDRLIEEIGDQKPYFYPFKRILMHAIKPSDC